MGLTLSHRSSGGLVSRILRVPASWPTSQCMGLRGWVLSGVSQHLCCEGRWQRLLVKRWRAAPVPQASPSWQPLGAQAGAAAKRAHAGRGLSTFGHSPPKREGCLPSLRPFSLFSACFLRENLKKI